MKVHDLMQAVDLALAGDWERAHEIVQQDETDLQAAWIHAVLHRIEGDLGNARYWYRRAGRQAVEDRDPDDELREIRGHLSP